MAEKNDAALYPPGTSGLDKLALALLICLVKERGGGPLTINIGEAHNCSLGYSFLKDGVVSVVLHQSDPKEVN